MRTFVITMLPAIALVTLSAGAAAQSSGEEARAMAAQATAAHEREAWTHAPVARQVTAGDYRAEAHERERLLQWQASQRAVRAYEAGSRSRPLAVDSEVSARAEAHRVVVEQDLARRVDVVRTARAVQ